MPDGFPPLHTHYFIGKINLKNNISLPNPKQNRRKKRIIIVAIVTLIIIASVTVFLWHVHLRQLRNDMDTHFEHSISYIESGRNQRALLEATEAERLATRLQDNDSLHIITAHIRLIEEVIRGQEFFESERYQSARNAYLWALDYAAIVYNLNPSFIYALIEIADEYIHFFELIDNAKSLLAQSDYLAAQSLFENALTIAQTLSFADGIDLSENGIVETQERMIRAKIAEAEALVLQGDTNFSSGNYTESIVYYQAALEIFYELEHTDGIIDAHSKIGVAERRIEELERAAQAAAEAAARAEAAAAVAAELAAAEEAARNANNAAHEVDNLQNNQTADIGVTSGSDPQIEIDMNYEHNRSINFDLVTLIDNQNQSPANQVRLGAAEGLNEGWRNGCGWISAYNALILLENPRHPAEIVRHIESGGGAVFSGVFGTFPHAIERLFLDLGYNVNHTLFPGRSVNIDNAIRSSRVSILAYTHTRAAHFITIEYRESDGKFIVYNDSFARRRALALGLENHTDIGATVDSISALIRETPDMLFSFSLITIF